MSANTIEITPTWGEIGNLFMRLALSNEVRAIEAMKSEIAKAMAGAQALIAIQKTLTDEQQAIVAKTLTAELTKQGF